MDIPEYLGLLAGVLLTAGFAPYIYEVIKKTTIPNRASWLIWSLSTAIVLIGVINTGTTEAIWVPIADAIGCFVIFALSIPFGTGGWSKTDKISLLVSLFSLLMWAATGNLFVAFIMNLVIYISGYIPTIYKSLEKPDSESRTAWTFFFAGVVLNLITVMIGNDRGFEVWIYPITLFIVVGALWFLLFRNILRGLFKSI